MGLPETMAVIAGTGLAVTVIVVLVRASYQLGRLSSQANSHEIAIRDLNGRVDHLDAKFDAKFDALEAKFDAKFDALDAKFETKFDALDTKFEAKFDALDAKFEAKFEALEAKFDARFDALTTAINELRDEVQQINRILVGLANHTHDADGRTVFTIPS